MIVLQREYYAQLSTHDIEIGQVSANIASLEREITIYNAFNDQFPSLNAEYTRYKLYAECLDNPALKASIIKKNIDRVIGKCNDILSLVTDFRLTYADRDGNIDINMEEKGQTLSIDLASGFQRFIVSITMRLVLASIAPACAEFITIDEGFGCMDNANMMRLPELFSLITDDFRFTFIISHIPDLQSVITLPLHIHTRRDDEINDDVSYIYNDICTANELTALNEINDAHLQEKTIKLNEIASRIPMITQDVTPIGTDKKKYTYSCICGATVKLSSKAAHLKTAKHLKSLKVG